MEERVVQVPRIVQQTRNRNIEGEKTVDVHVPQQQDEIVHVPKVVLQERIQKQIVEQVIEAPVPVMQEEIVHADAYHLCSAPQPIVYCFGSRLRFCVQKRGTERP